MWKKTSDEHAEHNTAKLDRSRPVRKGAATRRRLGEQVAVNTHTMGTSFVGKVRDVRQIAEAQIGKGVADMVELKAQVNGHEVTEKATRIQAWQGISDWQLADRFDKDRPVLLLPGSWWSGQHEPEFESAGWWQKPTRRACRTTNQDPQQTLIGMIFTNADPRYAGRLDDKQGGDTIVTMERVREGIAFNAELADESS